METILLNRVASIRRQKMNGRDYFVAPSTMIVPGVLNGSQGRLLYTPSEIAKNPQQWNGVPLTIGHPKDDSGRYVSARSPAILDRYKIGEVFETNAEGRLVSEAWFDVELLTRSKHPQASIIRNKLERGEPIELSTGLFTTNQPAPRGSSWFGQPYDYVATDFRPDHLAVLVDQKGACSQEHGCGIGVVNSDPDGEPDEADESDTAIHEDGDPGDVTGNESFWRRVVNALIGNAGPNQPKSLNTGKFKKYGAGTGKGECHEAAQTGAYGPKPETNEACTCEDKTDCHCEEPMNANAYCPTGEGGGIDNSCSSKGGADGGGGKFISMSEDAREEADGTPGHTHEQTATLLKALGVSMGKRGQGGKTTMIRQVKETGAQISKTLAAKGFKQVHTEDRSGVTQTQYEKDGVVIDVTHFTNPSPAQIKAGMGGAEVVSWKRKGSRNSTRNSYQPHNQESPMTKKDAITYLTTNCSCWKGEEKTLETFTENKLKEFVEQDKLAKEHQIVANAVTGVLDDLGVEVAANEMPAFLKKKIAGKPGASAPVEDDEEEDDEEDEPAMNKKKPVANYRPKTAEEWLDTAPPEIQSAVRNAMAIESRQKRALVEQLTANVKDAKRKAAFVTNLTKKDLGELSDLLALRGDPTPAVNEFVSPVYFGAAGAAPPTVNVDYDRNDFLPLPTINYAELAKQTA